jgi:hypothetical protein
MIAPAHNAHAIVLDSDIVRRQVVQCGCVSRSAIVELETRVMPGTTQRLANQQALIKRRTVVRALGANGEPVDACVDEQHWFAERMTRNELARRDTARVNAARQIRPGQLVGMFCHFRLLRIF